jgi:hypothetical protein
MNCSTRIGSQHIEHKDVTETPISNNYDDDDEANSVPSLPNSVIDNSPRAKSAPAAPSSVMLMLPSLLVSYSSTTDYASVFATVTDTGSISTAVSPAVTSPVIL